MTEPVRPTVSVLIVNYNVKNYLLHAIDQVQSSDYDGLIEIIVVDNNSYDGSVMAIKENYPAVTVIANKTNAGFGKAINQAFAKSRGEYLLILNPDTIIENKTIDTLVSYLESHPEVGMAGPKILNADGSLQLACKRSFPTISVALPKLLGLSYLFPKSRWAGKYNLTYLDPDQIHAVDAISGSCMFVRRSLFAEIGGFDERFFMFGEDLDLCYRIHQRGYTIHYVPRTQIIHFHGESVKSAPFDSLQAFYDAMILFSEKHFSSGSKFLTRTGIRWGVRVRQFVSLIANSKSQILSVSFDAIAVLLAFALALPLRFPDYEPVYRTYGFIPGVYVVFWLLIGMLFQLYSRYILSYSRAILSTLSGFFIAVVFTYFFKQFAFSRLVIIVATIIIAILIPGWRIVFHYLMSRGRFHPIRDKHGILFTRRTLILGTDKESLRIAKHLLKRFDTGLNIIGFTDYKPKVEVDQLPAPFLGRIEEIRSIVQTHRIREIIFPTARFSSQEVLRVMDSTKDLRITYRMVPRNQDILLGKASIEEIGDYSFVNIEYTLFRRINWFLKRIFDFIFATVLVILLLPVLISLWSSRKQVVFLGLNHKRFTGYIFPKASSRFIRQLPLLFNVMKWEMSFVGSELRPIESGDEPEILCTPGLTGIQRLRHSNLSADDRQLLDHYYLQHQSFTLDMEILMKTLFSGQNA